jgi:hypothetical protein
MTACAEAILMQWCRYSESIDILYGTNTFFFSSDLMLRKMPSLVLPQRFASIISIVLVWSLIPVDMPPASPQAKTSYDKVWELLASMSGLRKLSVVFQTLPCGPLEEPDDDDAWLMPLDGLAQRNLELFDLTVTFSYFKRFQRRAEGKAYRLLEMPEFVRTFNCG